MIHEMMFVGRTEIGNFFPTRKGPFGLWCLSSECFITGRARAREWNFCLVVINYWKDFENSLLLNGKKYIKFDL